MRVARRSASDDSVPLQVGIVSPPTLPAETDVEQLFSELFRRVHPRAKALAELSLNREDAKDACADAFAELWYQRQRMRHDQWTDAYVIGIVLHKIKDALRRGSDVVSLEAAAEHLERHAYAKHDADARANDVAELLDEAVAGMPPQRRQVWLLLRAEKFTYKQVAAVMRVSEATVNRHLSLGNADVRETFARDGYRLASGERQALPNPETGERSHD